MAIVLAKLLRSFMQPVITLSTAAPLRRREEYRARMGATWQRTSACTTLASDSRSVDLKAACIPGEPRRNLFCRIDAVHADHRRTATETVEPTSVGKSMIPTALRTGIRGEAGPCAREVRTVLAFPYARKLEIR